MCHHHPPPQYDYQFKLCYGVQAKQVNLSILFFSTSNTYYFIENMFLFKYTGAIASLLCKDAYAISSALIQMDEVDGAAQTNANWQFILDNHAGDVDAYLAVHTDPETLESLENRGWFYNWAEWLAMFRDCITWGADLQKLRDTRGDAVFVAVASQSVLEDVELNLQIPILKKLLAAGFNINGRDARGMNALFYSILNGMIELTRFLLHHGADVNAECNTSTERWASYKGRYPLNVAVRNLPKANDLLLKHLLEHGASLELAFQSFAQRYSFGFDEVSEVKKLQMLVLQDLQFDLIDDRRSNAERRQAVRNIAMLQRKGLPNDVSSRIAADVFRHSADLRKLQDWMHVIQSTLTAVSANTNGGKQAECAAILRKLLDDLGARTSSGDNTHHPSPEQQEIPFYHTRDEEKIDAVKGEACEACRACTVM